MFLYHIYNIYIKLLYTSYFILITFLYQYDKDHFSSFFSFFLDISFYIYPNIFYTVFLHSKKHIFIAIFNTYQHFIISLSFKVYLQFFIKCLSYIHIKKVV